MSRHDGHDAFLAALYDPQMQVPHGLTHPKSGDAKSRFAIYRNNVIYGLMQNLRDGFPLLLELLGDATFDELAAAYARAHPPRSPLMFAYGAGLPDFIDAFTPLAELPYAGDVARLDLAMRRASQAGDHVAIAADILSKTENAGARLNLAPTLTLLRSDWPIHELYLFLNEAIATPPDMRVAQDLLIYRRQSGGVSLELLPAGGVAFLAALQNHQPVVDAAHGHDAALVTDMLTRLYLAGLITKMD